MEYKERKKIKCECYICKKEFETYQYVFPPLCEKCNEEVQAGIDFITDTSFGGE